MTTCCIRCSLKAGHPDVPFNDSGACTICQGKIDDRYLRQYRTVKRTFEEFQRAAPNRASNYDCLLMLSGGKDSIWMLDKMLREGGKRILAFTYNQPFESDKAVANLERVLDRLCVHHIRFSDKINQKKILQAAFAKAPPRVAPREKLPCMLCNMGMKVHAILFAAQMRIPYVLFCADPVQIVSSEISPTAIIDTMEATLGPELVREMFGEQLTLLRGRESERLPQLIYPYVGMPVREYNGERFCAELRAKGLYESNPVETHCSLFPLLNYYAYVNYDCQLYAREIASKVRNGEIPREVALELDREFRHVMLQVVGKAILNDEDRAAVRRVAQLFASLFADSEKTGDHLFNLLVSSRQVAEELGVVLEGLELGSRAIEGVSS